MALAGGREARFSLPPPIERCDATAGESECQAQGLSLWDENPTFGTNAP
jgi:hypothetical protein